MRAVMPEVHPHILQWRRETGADRWDEMWEGVLHMAPEPNRMHQDFELQLAVWLRIHWARPRGNKVYPRINVAPQGGWPDKDYRIPDIVLLTPDRFHIDRNEYFEGGPTVVVEIRSPSDETYEKLPFYASLNVLEVWVIDRDTKVPELHVLQGGDYHLKPPDDAGWLQSAATGIQLRSGRGQKLLIQIVGDESTREVLPED